jgi:hypothetical protein
MRLNCLNRTIIVGGSLERLRITDLNPRFGLALELDANTFKYSVLGNEGTKGVIIDKVSLNDLFDGIPQDITGINFDFVTGSVAPGFDIDLAVEEPIIDDVPLEEPGAHDDALSVHFCNWKRLVGLNDLSRAEVDLGTADDYLYVEARKSTIYRGSVAIKIK